MHDRTRPVLAVLSFLTAVPVGRGGGIGERDLRRGVVLFPAVGGAVGALVALVTWGANMLVSPFAAAVLGVAGGVAATAAFHLDGLGDVADGVGASLSGRGSAEAMRDPRLGTLGVAAVALDLLLKVSLIASLVAQGFPWAIVAAGALARAPAIALAWRLPYAGGGAGAWMDDVGAGTVAVGSVIALAIAVPSAGISTAGMALAVALAAAPIGWWSSRRLGGVTGDGFGATVELGESFALAAAVAMG